MLQIPKAPWAAALELCCVMFLALQLGPQDLLCKTQRKLFLILSSLLCKARAPEVLTQCDETAVKTIIKNKFPPSSFKCFSFYQSLLSTRSRVHGWRLFICVGWGSCWGAETLFVLFSCRRTLLYCLCRFFFPLLEMSGRTAMLSVYEYSVVVALGPLFLKQIWLFQLVLRILLFLGVKCSSGVCACGHACML